MPSFDAVSELDGQEVVNAVDQARREIANRYDFRDTGSSIELADDTITLKSVTEDRLTAVRQVLEEKFVKRKLSLKGLTFNNVEEAAGATVRQTATLTSGISSDKAREINKFIKGLRIKGMQSQTQGEEIRVTSKKRDDLQSAMAALKEEDFGIPLAFQNFRN
jgi:cyclic-di-GMP-binding protein